VYKPFYPEVPEFELPFTVSELELLYGPRDGFCQVTAISGAKFVLNLKDFIQTLDLEDKPAGKKEMPEMAFDYQVGRINFQNFNIKPLLEYQGQDFLELIGRQMTANQDFAINAENIAVNIEVNAESLMQLSCTIDKVEAGTTIAPEIFSSFLSPDKPSVSFAQLLSEGRIPLDISYGLQNLQIKVKGKEQNINVGLDSIKINYYLKPSAQNDLYDFGARNEISALQISGLPKPELEALAGIKKLNSSFALQRITPDAIDSYFKLIQSAKKLGTEQNEAATQELGMQGLAIIGSLVQAKPVIALAVSPLEHTLGKIEMTGQFQFIRMGPPVGKATVTIFALADLALFLQTTCKNRASPCRLILSPL